MNHIKTNWNYSLKFWLSFHFFPVDFHFRWNEAHDQLVWSLVPVKVLHPYIVHICKQPQTAASLQIRRAGVQRENHITVLTHCNCQVLRYCTRLWLYLVLWGWRCLTGRCDKQISLHVGAWLVVHDVILTTLGSNQFMPQILTCIHSSIACGLVPTFPFSPCQPLQPLSTAIRLQAVNEFKYLAPWLHSHKILHKSTFYFL